MQGFSSDAHRHGWLQLQHVGQGLEGPSRILASKLSIFSAHQQSNAQVVATTIFRIISVMKLPFLIPPCSDMNSDCRVRVKRRRATVDPAQELQRCKSIRIQPLSTPTTNSASSTFSDNEKRRISHGVFTTFGSCSEVVPDQVGVGFQVDAIGGGEDATVSGEQVAKRQQTRRRWRRGLFSKETLAGKLTESIPRLALLPQRARLFWRS